MSNVLSRKDTFLEENLVNAAALASFIRQDVNRVFRYGT